jgi:hypothetical protein
MDITKKSIGVLVDDLITTSMKLWHEQEKYNKPGVTDDELGKAFRSIQGLNARRNKLINAIDSILDPETFSTSIKTYK